MTAPCENLMSVHRLYRKHSRDLLLRETCVRAVLAHILASLFLACSRGEAGWLLLPPVYFWYEYFYVYGRTRNAAARADLESFKYGQDVASKIWIAVVSALLALYFGKDFRLG